jgi:ferredoxin
MKLMNNVAVPGPDCKACGKCAEFCPNGAVSVILEDEEILFRAMMDRIAARTKITSQ